MNLKKIILIFFSFTMLCSCAEYTVKNNKEGKERQYYSSTGFALIYEENLYKDANFSDLNFLQKPQYIY